MSEHQIALRYDSEADAWYIRLAHAPFPDPLGTGRFAKTHRLAPTNGDWPGDLNVDVDAEGRILGIEVPNAQRVLPYEIL
jgi:uncharacterized protein YuzE